MNRSCPDPKFKVADNVYVKALFSSFYGKVLSRRISIQLFYEGWVYLIRDENGTFHEIKETNIWRI